MSVLSNVRLLARQFAESQPARIALNKMPINVNVLFSFLFSVITVSKPQFEESLKKDGGGSTFQQRKFFLSKNVFYIVDTLWLILLFALMASFIQTTKHHLDLVWW